jgi:hypothetical protein
MSDQFKGINFAGYGGYELTSHLKYNIKWFLDQGMVEHGAYDAYTIGAASFFDSDESELHPVADERFVDGIVWEGAGREWVWESGLMVPSGAIEPFRPSGVYVDGNFYPTQYVVPCSYAHHVDYLNGRILFQLPQNSESDIRAAFTRRAVHVGFDEQEEFRTLMLEALEEFSRDRSPTSTPTRENQIWLPSIFIEVESGRQRGLQLGGGQIKTRFVHLHIFADKPADRDLLMDWLDKQSRSVFFMADLNKITFPYDEFGDVVPGTTNWRDLVDAYPYRKLRVVDGTMTKLDSLNQDLFRARVTWEIEIDIGNI